MSGGITRRFATWTAIAGLLALTPLPPQHLHADDADDHDGEVMHRHFAPHPLLGGAAHVEDADHDTVQWIDSLFTVQLPISKVVKPYVVSQIAVTALSDASIAREVFWFVPESHHDPPWVCSTGLRAPPSSPLV